MEYHSMPHGQPGSTRATPNVVEQPRENSSYQNVRYAQYFSLISSIRLLAKKKFKIQAAPNKVHFWYQISPNQLSRF